MTVHRLEVSKNEEIEALARTLAHAIIDVIIKNAGVNGPKQPFGETDYELWAASMAINAFDPMKITELFVEHVARSERKVIATVSSFMGSIELASGDGHPTYHRSKAAVNMVAKCITDYVAERGITTVAFSPGWAKTDIGGPGAPLEPAENVSGMRKLIEELVPEDTGQFIHFDSTELPW